VVEMATGKPPFIELGTPEAAMFKVGFYKVPPEIPKEMSETAKSFIMRCFEPDPEKRATSATLLEDPFIADMGKRKKMSKLNMSGASPVAELSRSISVPGERFSRAISRAATSPDTNDSGLVDTSCVLTGGTSDSSILSPTENSLLEHPLNPRRDSSGALPSPDVLDSPKEDGFYLLKKDSQRRETLVKVLKQDKLNICSTWHSLILKDVHDSCLTVGHLMTLMEGLRGYLPEQNKDTLQTAIAKLKDELDYDGAKINHLHLALYNFQDAVNAVLRMHSIKPHWMFALDNLVRAAVQAAILVLSPELGAHLADQGVIDAPPIPPPLEVPILVGDIPPLPMETEGGSTSGVSTVNSAFQERGHPTGMLNSLSRLREENRHLLGDLLQAQHSYQELLKQSLSEQKLHLQLLSQSLAASSLAARDAGQNRAALYSSQISTDDDSHSSEMMAPSTSNRKVEGESDEGLLNWLRALSLNQETINRIAMEEITLNDMLELISRDDLRRLGLRAGPELRIWRAVLQHREQRGGGGGASS